MGVKKKSLKSLSDGIAKFEDSRNTVKNSDFTTIKTFIKDYLNTAEPKQRTKLAQEFKKRHLELYSFIKENAELISAEAEITKTMQTVLSGDVGSEDTTNPFAGLSSEDLKKLISDG